MTTAAVSAPPDSIDVGIPWHYGDTHAEQRALLAGTAAVDISNRGVVTVAGPDRLTWLDDLGTQRVRDLQPGASALTLILSPHGHVEHELHLIDDGDITWLVTQPGTSSALVDHLRSMQFLLRVEVADRSADFGVVWEPTYATDNSLPTWLVPTDFAGTGHVDAGSDRGGDASKYVAVRPGAFAGREVVVPREGIDARLAEHDRAGSWALESLRVAAAVPRLGLDTDHRTLPHEVGWIGPAVHLAKGCYRGQEAVTRVHNLGHPPRRLALLHLDGSEGVLPVHGDVIEVDGREVGLIGTPARHFELGPIATGMLKRNVPVDAVLSVRTDGDEVTATQEVVVTP